MFNLILTARFLWPSVGPKWRPPLKPAPWAPRNGSFSSGQAATTTRARRWAALILAAHLYPVSPRANPPAKTVVLALVCRAPFNYLRVVAQVAQLEVALAVVMVVVACQVVVVVGHAHILLNPF